MDKYIGFYIDKPIGNNIFSYEDRENKKIYVPKLIEGTLDDVSIGEEIVFNEIDEDIEIKAKGLKNMIIYKYQDKDVKVTGLNVINDLVKIETNNGIVFVGLDEIKFDKNNHAGKKNGKPRSH
mgnify:CR=1 FL=1